MSISECLLKHAEDTLSGGLVQLWHHSPGMSCQASCCVYSTINQEFYNPECLFLRLSWPGENQKAPVVVNETIQLNSNLLGLSFKGSFWAQEWKGTGDTCSVSLCSGLPGITWWRCWLLAPGSVLASMCWAVRLRGCHCWVYRILLLQDYMSDHRYKEVNVSINLGRVSRLTEMKTRDRKERKCNQPVKVRGHHKLSKWKSFGHNAFFLLQNVTRSSTQKITDISFFHIKPVSGL